MFRIHFIKLLDNCIARVKMLYIFKVSNTFQRYNRGEGHNLHRNCNDPLIHSIK